MNKTIYFASCRGGKTEQLNAQAQRLLDAGCDVYIISTAFGDITGVHHPLLHMLSTESVLNHE